VLSIVNFFFFQWSGSVINCKFFFSLQEVLKLSIVDLVFFNLQEVLKLSIVNYFFFSLQEVKL